MNPWNENSNMLLYEKRVNSDRLVTYQVDLSSESTYIDISEDKSERMSTILIRYQTTSKSRIRSLIENPKIGK